MAENIFDFFGGMANLPDDPSNDELDLSDLESADVDSAKGNVDKGVEASSGDESNAGNERPSAANSETPQQEPSRPGQREDSHWLDLASTLGVAIGSTQFEPSANKPHKATPRPSPAKKPPRPAPKSTPSAAGHEDSVFGRGLLDDAPDSDEENRQKQLLSKLFVPTGEAFEEQASEIRQVDDMEIIDEEIVDEEENEDELIGEVMIDDEMVEFEVEELSGSEEHGRSEFGRRPTTPRESAPRRPENIEPSGPRDAEHSKPERQQPRGRDEGPRRRPRRGDRGGRDRPSSSSSSSSVDRPAPPEKKVRSQVLPADEDFIIDPIDDDLGNETEESRPDAAGSKSIKFPTWNETVNPIIEANIARRNRSKGRPRRPPSRDRGGND